MIIFQKVADLKETLRLYQMYFTSKRNMIISLTTYLLILPILIKERQPATITYSSKNLLNSRNSKVIKLKLNVILTDISTISNIILLTQKIL